MKSLASLGVLSAGLWLAAAAPASAQANAAPAAPGFWAWAPTPPMGWNSYDAWGDSVTEDQVLANAQYLQQHLLAHGWKYLVIDFRWYDPNPTGNDRLLNRTRTGAKLAADAFGRLLPAPDRFPSAATGNGFKPLADEIHGMGLRFGLHVMRGIPRQAVLANTPIADSSFTAAQAGNPEDRCPWCPDMFGVQANAAGQAWYDAEFKLLAAWGVDFVKVDDLSVPYHQAEIEMIRRAIDRSGRAIVFSTSPGPTEISHADNLEMNANQWRISGDFWDKWSKLNHQFELFENWAEANVTGPGHFPDGDMIPFGRLAIRSAMDGKDHRTHFTPDEQTTLMSLWALASSPLMLGMNLPDDDAATDALLTNDEVLRVDQDALCLPARRVAAQNGGEVWVKRLSDGAKAIGLFNRGDAVATVVLNWPDAQLAGKQNLRDLWRHQDLGAFTQSFSIAVPPHGAVLVRCVPAP
jgi:hypothetical protein